MIKKSLIATLSIFGKFYFFTSSKQMRKVGFSFFFFLLLHTRVFGEIQVATFLQDASIYSSSVIPTVSDMDQINLQFKTKQDSSYLFYVGTQPSNSESDLQYIYMYLLNKQLGIRIKHDRLGESVFHVPCISIYFTCADNRWHKLSVSRKKNMIKVISDGKTVLDKEVGVAFTHLLSQLIVFGSNIPTSSESKKLQRNFFLKNMKNFKGCMQKIIYSTDNVNLEILAQAKMKRHFQTLGEIDFGKCTDLFVIEPISFTTEESYIMLTGWAWTQKGKLQFTFKTVELNALLVYQKAEHFHTNQFDFYAFEIRQSFLYFSVNTGSGVFNQKISKGSVSDGGPHCVKMWFENGKVEVQLDRDKKIEKANTLYRVLDITGDLYIGNIPEYLVPFLPHSLWSGRLRYGFVGCLVEIIINDEQYDLALKVLNENISDIENGCPHDLFNSGHCENRPCMDGACFVGYNRFLCDCSKTNYTGNTCEKVAPLVKFNGYQYMIIKMPNGFQSECEDIVIRFFTTRPDGILIITNSIISGAPDRLEMFLENGKLIVLFNFGRGNKIIQSNVSCFDGNWHTIKLMRRQLLVTVIIDDLEKKYSLSGTSKFLSNDIITLGRYKDGKISKYFTGFMTHFTFNGINYFQMAKDDSPPNIEVTATIDDTDQIKEFPISFTSNSYVHLPKIEMHEDFEMEFLIRTRNKQGSLLQFYDKKGDFLILELINGYLNLLFSWGKELNRYDRKGTRLNDNKWHKIILVKGKSHSNSFVFQVDDQPKGEQSLIYFKPNRFIKTIKNGFLGSSKKYLSKVNLLRENMIYSEGFKGCIASFYMNHTKSRYVKSVYQNLLEISKESYEITEGCLDDSQHQIVCSQNTCNSGGRCIQQWTRIRCDCTMTTFIGERCDKVSKTLKFNDYPAFLIYKMSPTKNTIHDELAFGIQTSIITSSPIILIEGEGKQSDFVAAKLIKDKGRVLMVFEYNMGSGISRIIESSVNIADGFYHRVAFRRKGNFATLQIDDFEKKTLLPRDKPSIHFNQQHTVYIGSHPIVSERSEQFLNDLEWETFTGYLSGLYFNQILLNDMVDNVSYPGIKLVNRSNVYIEHKFIPNFQPNKQIKLSEQAIVHDNDRKNSPIVVAKQNCSVFEPIYNCKVSNSTGIIRPFVTYQVNYITSTQITTVAANIKIFTENGDNGPMVSTSYRLTELTNDGGSGVINIWLIIGFSAGGCLLLVFITCFIYKCFRKDEGSYNVEEDHIYIDVTYKSLDPGNSNKAYSQQINDNKTTMDNYGFNFSKQKFSKNSRTSNTKEWYV